LALAWRAARTPGAVEAAAWFARALTLFSIEHRLAGAFAGNPYPEVVNGPLWSLSHEVTAYAVCAVFVASLAARRPAAGLGLIGIAALASGMSEVLPGRAATFAPLFVAFALGMAPIFSVTASFCARSLRSSCCRWRFVVLPWPLAIASCLAMPVLP
jgi:peptidoglycan/LPS O-acetylase OafA/YrhL